MGFHFDADNHTHLESFNVVNSSISMIFGRLLCKLNIIRLYLFEDRIVEWQGKYLWFNCSIYDFQHSSSNCDMGGTKKTSCASGSGYLQSHSHIWPCSLFLYILTQYVRFFVVNSVFCPHCLLGLLLVKLTLLYSLTCTKCQSSEVSSSS